MSPTLSLILTLTSGVSWSIVYLVIIYRGFKDKTYGMPLFALAFNIAWEFLYAFPFIPELSVQKVVNIVWFLLDAVIVFTYFKYGRREFPARYQRFFIPWSLAPFAVGLATIIAMKYEFEGSLGAIYSAFAQNLMMSLLFIGMLVKRNGIEGQSMYVAIFKWLGTLAPTIQVSLATGSALVLVLGIAIFIYDVIYIGMLYQKFAEMKRNPFTHKPASNPAILMGKEEV